MHTSTLLLMGVLSFFLCTLGQLSFEAEDDLTPLTQTPVLASSLKVIKDASACLPAPYLYVTLHHYPNVIKYSRDGCLLSMSVLGDGQLEMGNVELRSMYISAESQRLYIANAAAGNHQVLVYGQCGSAVATQNNNGDDDDDAYSRKLLGVITNKKKNHGADHAYGLALDEHQNVYASFQHTDVVLRFSASTYEEMSFPPSLRAHKDQEYYAGTFHQFGKPGLHDTTEQGVRGIIVVNRALWVANEDIGGIAIIDMKTGLVTDIIMLDEPIGLFYSETHKLVFASSKAKHMEGRVVSIDVKTLRIINEYRSAKMTHPTGVVVHEDTLYVAEQFLGHVFAFDIFSTENLGKVIEKLPGEIEQIVLSEC